MTDMSDLNENLGRIAESNERSAESLLQIQRMIFALVVVKIVVQDESTLFVDRPSRNVYRS